MTIGDQLRMQLGMAGVIPGPMQFVPSGVFGGQQAGMGPPDLRQHLLGGGHQAVQQPMVQQPARQLPAWSDADVQMLNQMNREQVLAARQQLAAGGFLNPEIDQHFSRRLQALQMQQR